MQYPDIAAVPAEDIRQSVSSQIWNDTVQAWAAIIRAYSKLDDRDFATVCKTTNLSQFLRSFYKERSTVQRNDKTLSLPAVSALAQRCLTLLSRAQASGQLSSLLQDLAFLEHLARCHARSDDLQQLLSRIWQSEHRELSKWLARWQVTTINELESPSANDSLRNLEEIAPLLHSSPDLATALLTGSDMLESAQACYTKSSDLRVRRALVVVIYLSLVGLATAQVINLSLLSDHLYSLKAGADPASSLLADLVTNTPLLRRLRQAGTHDRLTKVLDKLQAYQSPTLARRPKPRAGKGKQRAGVDHELHVHRMSLVTQVQDLFPDLGAGFVLRLLDQYDDNVEDVTAHLLDGSLPPTLQQADRSEPAPVFDADRGHVVDQLIPRTTPSPAAESFVPQRHNAFDDDEFDRLDFDTSRLHIGKREGQAVEEHQPNKAAILAALAAFDSDDDERDDTYDAEDVGGTVDTAHHDGDDSQSAPFDENDLKLFKHHEASPADFGRSGEVRRSAARAALKKETGLTDEALEGWAIMLQRDPKRARKLAFEAARFDGRQQDIARTSYREGAETDDSDAAAQRASPGFRGRGRAGRGRGDASGQRSEPGTAADKRRKEASKSSRANHNRRNQRARKMARGGGSFAVAE